ncbi:MAG: hypothetical protein ACR2P2_15015, partial [Nakamurella sp.]
IVEVFLLGRCQNLHHAKTSTPTNTHPRLSRSNRHYTLVCEEPDNSSMAARWIVADRPARSERLSGCRALPRDALILK